MSGYLYMDTGIAEFVVHPAIMPIEIFNLFHEYLKSYRRVILILEVINFGIIQPFLTTDKKPFQ